VVGLDVSDLRAPELQQEVGGSGAPRRNSRHSFDSRWSFFQARGFALTHERLPYGGAKTRIVRAVDRAGGFVPLRALLRFLRLSPSRFHAWRRLQHA
jgi:hypothetical protein